MGDIAQNPTDCCFEPDSCNYCTAGWPTSWTIEVEGITTIACLYEGEDCIVFNGTYTVDDSSVISEFWCGTTEFLFPSPSLLCAINGLDVTISKSGSDYILFVSLFSPSADGINWEKNLGTTKPDCRSFSGEVCVFNSDTTQCSGASGSSTATVTAN